MAMAAIYTITFKGEHFDYGSSRTERDAVLRQLDTLESNLPRVSHAPRAYGITGDGTTKDGESIRWDIKTVFV